MKKIIILFVVSMICSFSFGLTWKTGELAGSHEGNQATWYLPSGFKYLKNKNKIVYLKKIKNCKLWNRDWRKI